MWRWSRKTLAQETLCVFLVPLNLLRVLPIGWTQGEVTLARNPDGAMCRGQLPQGTEQCRDHGGEWGQ